MRFTLGNMFLAVTMLALACAGVTFRTQWWANGIVTLTVLLYVGTALRAVGLRGRDRAFAIAFSIVGGSYLKLETSNLFSTVRDSLPTDHILAVAYRAYVTLPTGWEEISFLRNLDLLRNRGPVPLANDFLTDSSAFFLIGHCVWSWLFALLAGWFCGAA